MRELEAQRIVYRARTAVRLLELASAETSWGLNDRFQKAHDLVLEALEQLYPFTLEDDEPGDGYEEIRASYGMDASRTSASAAGVARHNL